MQLAQRNVNPNSPISVTWPRCSFSARASTVSSGPSRERYGGPTLADDPAPGYYDAPNAPALKPCEEQMTEVAQHPIPTRPPAHHATAFGGITGTAPDVPSNTNPDLAAIHR